MPRKVFIQEATALKSAEAAHIIIRGAGKITTRTLVSLSFYLLLSMKMSPNIHVGTIFFCQCCEQLICLNDSKRLFMFGSVTLCWQGKTKIMVDFARNTRLCRSYGIHLRCVEFMTCIDRHFIICELLHILYDK